MIKMILAFILVLLAVLSASAITPNVSGGLFLGAMGVILFKFLYDVQFLDGT